MLAIVQLIVPMQVPDPPSEFTHVTLVTPMLSDAVPAIDVYGVVAVYIGLEAGVVIVQVGVVGS